MTAGRSPVELLPVVRGIVARELREVADGAVPMWHGQNAVDAVPVDRLGALTGDRGSEEL